MSLSLLLLPSLLPAPSLSPSTTSGWSVSRVPATLARRVQAAAEPNHLVPRHEREHMTEKIGAALDEFEIEEFLESSGLGVLGLAKEGAAYTIPIAFAYDEGNNRCILRFVGRQDSKKREFAAATRTATLTVYDWEAPEAWRSVVLVGTLSELDSDSIASAAALFADVGEEAALDIFNKPLEEYETAWYEFNIAEMTGRAGY